tara:strand:+ start:2025 stop:2741 length:717 start_codon:yes stop_codon:yes gene_type:complete
MIDLSIVIPCYNEDENIFPLFVRIEKLLKKNSNVEIIIVDNGSTDNTNKNILNSELYLMNKIKVLEIKKNIGYGYGVMSGLKISTGQFIGFCHADLHPEPNTVLESYLQNIDKLKTGKFILKGRRRNRNIFDTVFTFGMSLFSSVIFQKILSDVNAQPKLFPKLFLKFLKDCPNDFSLDLYILVMAKINYFKVINHDVIMEERIYNEAKGGGNLKGKIKLIIRTFLYTIKLRKYLWKL